MVNEIQNNYDDYEINTLSDLFRLIELRLREAKGTPPIKGVASRERLLKDSYEEALGHARKLRKANPKLIEPPPRTPNDEENLKNLRDWCTDHRRFEIGKTELPNDLVSCQEVALVLHKRSDSVARSLKNDGLCVVKLGGKYYCRLKHAMVKWSERKKRLKKLLKQPTE